MMEDELVTQGLLSVPIVHAIDFLKARGWMSDKVAGRVSFAISAVMAFVVAIGVHIHFQGSWTGGGEFHGSWPTLDVMVTGAEHFLASFAPQQVYFMMRQHVAIQQALLQAIKGKP